MYSWDTKKLGTAFFIAAAAVCSGPAIAQTGPAGSDEVRGTDMPQPRSDDAPDQTPGLFDEEPDVLPEDQRVEVGTFGQIDITVDNLEISRVLQLLSIQSQRNIVASRNVSGTVTASLYGVDFYEALDAILQPNGYGYLERGNFIYVYTQDEINQIEAQDRQLETRILRLNYLNAADAAAFVSNMLSEAGSIAVSGEAGSGFQPSVSDGGGNTFADSDTLVIRDYESNVEQILGVIDQLDIRPRQVIIEATVLQARLSENNAFGVDFAIFNDLDFTDFVNPLNAVDELIAGDVSTDGTGGSVVSTVGNVAAGDGGLKIGVTSDEAGVFVRALDSVTDTVVLATPRLTVLDRQRAEILVGERLGYLSTTVTDTSETQTVEFLDVGTQLTVRPFVSDDGFIRMELRPSVSDGETVVIGTTVVPNETTQEMVTNVILQSGQTIVLGGLFKEDTTISRNQVPGLGDVPVVGLAFQGQDDTVSRSEVIFLLTATIMENQTLVEMGDNAEDRIQLARLGARQGLLPWSRTRLTASHMRDAISAWEEGDRDRALWSVNVALHLDPTLGDGLELKQEITGEQIAYFDYSLNNSIYDDAIAQQVGTLGPDEQAEPEQAMDALEAAMEAEADADEPMDAGGPVEESGDQLDPEAPRDINDVDPGDLEPMSFDAQEPAIDMADAAEALDEIFAQSAPETVAQADEPQTADDEAFDAHLWADEYNQLAPDAQAVVQEATITGSDTAETLAEGHATDGDMETPVRTSLQMLEQLNDELAEYEARLDDDATLEPIGTLTEVEVK